VTVLSAMENALIEKGFDNMSVYEKNNLIVLIADGLGIGYSDVTSDTILNYHKQIKTPILSDQCEDDIVNGFTSTVNGHHYRTNRDDQTNMIGQKDELMDDQSITIVPWKTEDQGYIDHTRDDWLTIYHEAFQAKKQKLFKYDSLKKKVIDAKTHDEIVLIKWDDSNQTTT
jgi:hypothetical protein